MQRSMCWWGLGGSADHQILATTGKVKDKKVKVQVFSLTSLSKRAELPNYMESKV